MPFYNRVSTLGRAMQSIAAQTRQPDRLILIDNNSTDGSVEAARDWADGYRGPMKITLLHEEKRGACAARNCGLAACDTDLVVHFDSDDAMRPRLIERALAPFEADPTLDIVHWTVELHQGSGPARALKYAPRGGMRFHIFHSLLRTQGYAVKRRLLMRAGAWDESLPLWNDWELGIRLLLLEPRMKPAGEVAADAYLQPDSLTGSDFHTSGRGRELALLRAEEAVGRSDAPHKQLYLRMLGLRRAILGGLYAREGHRDSGRRLLAEALERAGGATDRLLMRGAYGLTGAGLRGASDLAAFMS